jgi:hypothetical protein
MPPVHQALPLKEQQDPIENGGRDTYREHPPPRHWTRPPRVTRTVS